MEAIYEDLPVMFGMTASLNDGNSSSTLINTNSTSSPLRVENKASSSEVHNYSITNASSFLKTRKICACPKKDIQWTWDDNNKSDYVEILNNRMEVRFNKRYSSGTAVVRCTEPMSEHQYYWEVKMTYPVYGTDIMVGVGTPEARVTYLQDRYVSRLGMDEQTWGFSCHGLFHHNGERRCYAQKFDQGNIIGVHLDLWRGTLSFYKDRKPLGIASSGLKGKTLYAMASSTAACSGMKIVQACCFPSSLQFLCAAKLREIIPDDKNVLDAIDVPPGLRQFLKTNLSWLLDKPDLEEDFKTCCMLNNLSYDEELDNAESVVGGRRELDSCSTEGMFILIGSVIVDSSSQGLNRRAISDTETVNSRDNSPVRESKRLRTSYRYVYGLSDYDSD